MRSRPGKIDGDEHEACVVFAGARPSRPLDPRRRVEVLRARDYAGVFVRASKEALDDHVSNLAAALAYYAFLAIPSLLLVAVAAFGLFAGPEDVSSILQRLSGVVPTEAVTLIDDALGRVIQQQTSSRVTMAAIGLILALWSLSGAMQTLMWALNQAYEREETRGFLHRRLTALAMVALLLLASSLAFGLLVLGPYLSDWIGSATGAEALVQWLWWTAQWPILVLGLLLAFATILYLGPDVDQPRWTVVTPGTVFAVVLWLAALWRLRALRERIRLLQQDLGLARSGDHHAHLALAQLPRFASRRRVELRGGAVAGARSWRLGGDRAQGTARGIVGKHSERVLRRT